MSSREFKIIFVGENGVGKTSIIHRLVKGSFPDEGTLATIDVEMSEKKLQINGEDYVLKIADTAGQERFRNMTRSHYENSNGVLLVFDVTDKDSFNNLPKWLEDMNQYAPRTDRILVGNKIDLTEDRVVDKDSAETFAKSNGFTYFEMSAKEGKNADSSLEALTGMMIESRDYEIQNPKTDWTNISGNDKKKKKKQCIIS